MGQGAEDCAAFCLTNVIAVALEAEFPFTVGHAGFAFAYDECTD